MGPCKSVRHLVQGAVPSHRDHQVESLVRGASSEVGGVSLLLGLVALDLELGAQRALDDVDGPRVTDCALTLTIGGGGPCPPFCQMAASILRCRRRRRPRIRCAMGSSESSSRSRARRGCSSPRCRRPGACRAVRSRKRSSGSRPGSGPPPRHGRLATPRDRGHLVCVRRGVREALAAPKAPAPGAGPRLRGTGRGPRRLLAHWNTFEAADPPAGFDRSALRTEHGPVRQLGG